MTKTRVMVQHTTLVRTYVALQGHYYMESFIRKSFDPAHDLHREVSASCQNWMG